MSRIRKRYPFTGAYVSLLHVVGGVMAAFGVLMFLLALFRGGLAMFWLGPSLAIIPGGLMLLVSAEVLAMIRDIAITVDSFARREAGNVSPDTPIEPPTVPVASPPSASRPVFDGFRRWLVEGLDAKGQPIRGTVTASSEAEAREKASRACSQIRKVEPATDSA